MADVQFKIVKGPGAQAPETPKGSTPPAKPQATVEDIKEAVSDVTSRLFGRPVTPEPAIEPQPQPPGQPTNPPPAAPEPPVEPPQPEPPGAPQPPVVVPAITPEDVRRAVREEMRSNTPPPPAVQPPPTVEVELGEEDLDDLKGLRYLEKVNKLPKGTADKYLAFVKLNYEYQDKWVAEHPDKEFSWDEEEHRNWYDANVPELPDKKIIEKAARQADMDEELDKRWQEQMQPRIDMENANDAWAAVLPQATLRLDAKLVDLVEKVNPELAKLLKKDGKPNLGPEAEKALDEADPVASDEINEVIRTGLLDVLVELEKMPIEACMRLFNPKQNPVHHRIKQTIQNAEREMANAPRETQMLDGKQWISSVDYDKRLNAAPASERESVQAELNRTTWRITVDDVAELFIDDAAKRAKEAIEFTKKKVDRYAKKGSNPPQPPPSGGNQPPPPNPPTPPVPPAARRGSPDLSSSADVTSPGQPTTTGEKSLGQRVTDQLFRK